MAFYHRSEASTYKTNCGCLCKSTLLILIEQAFDRKIEAMVRLVPLFQNLTFGELLPQEVNGQMRPRSGVTDNQDRLYFWSYAGRPPR